MIVLNTTPAHAAFLMVLVGLSGSSAGSSFTALIEPVGRRGAGIAGLWDGGAADGVSREDEVVHGIGNMGGQVRRNSPLEGDGYEVQFRANRQRLYRRRAEQRASRAM